MTRLGSVLVATAVIQLLVLRRLRFDAFIIAIVLAGMALDVHYWSYTPVAERNYDAASHIEYIQSIADGFRLPEATSCVACGHPPLYYALAALWSKSVALATGLTLELGLQWLSLLLFFSFVVFSLLVFRSCTRDTWRVRIAAALVVFWPSSILNSIRVHNDALASPLMLAAMYFTAEWDKSARSRDFSAALAFSALALMTKASGYAVATTLLLFIVLKVRSAEGRPLALRQLASAVGVLGGTGLLMMTLRASRSPRTPCQLLLGAACNSRYVPPLPDSPSRFLSFHLHDFVTRLAVVPEDPVLNRAAKSSLFGVIALGEPFMDARHERLASCLSAGLLAMLGACVLGLPVLGRAALRKNRVYLASVAIMVLCLLAFRLRAPNEFHEDFRHIFAALVPACLGYARIVTKSASRSKALPAAGVVLALWMVGASIAFFVQ